jgi:protein gp37
MLEGTPRRIRLFADSNSDWLDDRWPIETLAAFLQAIHDAPNVDVLLLTKRPENWLPRVLLSLNHLAPAPSVNDEVCAWIENWIGGDAPKNIWLGVSCENQEMADKRIPELLKIPAAVRFVSAEPLLGPIDFYAVEPVAKLGGYQNYPPDPIQWVIVGGESGKNHRPCSVEWIKDIADQCQAAGVPVWVKQDAAHKPLAPRKNRAKFSTDDPA